MGSHKGAKYPSQTFFECARYEKQRKAIQYGGKRPANGLELTRCFLGALEWGTFGGKEELT